MILRKVIDVKALEDYKILITFENNEKKIFDAIFCCRQIYNDKGNS